MLAVSSHDNGIKILANADGLRLLRTFENRPFDSSRSVMENVSKVTISDPSNFWSYHLDLRKLALYGSSCFLMQNVASSLSAGAVATSSGLVDRASPAVTITGMVSEFSSRYFFSNKLLNVS